MYQETFDLESVTLNVMNLPYMVAFYQQALGMAILEESPERVGLGVQGSGRPLLYLEAVSAPDESQARYGLYHVAYLLPSQEDLGTFLVHAIKQALPLIGASDHGYSEAIYLEDPEGNGIEVYRDKPISQWDIEPDGRIPGVTLEMDGQGVYDSAKPLDGPYQMPEGSRIGHIHLSVQDSKRAAVWWNQVLGMETKFQMSSAAWMSSGTYHHQVAANQWAGSRLAPQEPDQAGLKHFSIVAGSPQEEAAIVKRAQDLGAKVQGLEGGWQVTDSNGISLVLRSL